MVQNMAYMWFFSQLPVFGIGILVYHFFEKYKHVQDRRLGYVLIITAFFLIFTFLETSTYHDLLTHHVLLSIAFGMLALGLYFSQTKVLVNFVTKWIGKLSYSMYFVHFFVIRFIEYLFPNQFRGTGYLILAYIVVVAITILVSLVTYHIIEKRGIMLGKYIIESLEKRSMSNNSTKQNLLTNNE